MYCLNVVDLAVEALMFKHVPDIQVCCLEVEWWCKHCIKQAIKVLDRNCVEGSSRPDLEGKRSFHCKKNLLQSVWKLKRIDRHFIPIQNPVLDQLDARMETSAHVSNNSVLANCEQTPSLS